MAQWRLLLTEEQVCKNFEDPKIKLLNALVKSDFIQKETYHEFEHETMDGLFIWNILEKVQLTDRSDELSKLVKIFNDAGQQKIARILQNCKELDTVTSESLSETEASRKAGAEKEEEPEVEFPNAINNDAATQNSVDGDGEKLDQSHKEIGKQTFSGEGESRFNVGDHNDNRDLSQTQTTNVINSFSTPSSLESIDQQPHPRLQVPNKTKEGVAKKRGHGSTGPKNQEGKKTKRPNYKPPNKNVPLENFVSSVNKKIPSVLKFAVPVKTNRESLEWIGQDQISASDITYDGDFLSALSPKFEGGKGKALLLVWNFNTKDEDLKASNIVGNTLKQYKKYRASRATMDHRAAKDSLKKLTGNEVTVVENLFSKKELQTTLANFKKEVLEEESAFIVVGIVTQVNDKQQLLLDNLQDFHLIKDIVYPLSEDKFKKYSRKYPRLYFVEAYKNASGSDDSSEQLTKIPKMATTEFARNFFVDFRTLTMTKEPNLEPAATMTHLNKFSKMLEEADEMKPSSSHVTSMYTTFDFPLSDFEFFDS